MELVEIIEDIANCLAYIDGSRIPFGFYKPGVGPYGEPQLLREVATFLNEAEKYGGNIQTRRTPDLLVPSHWAIEFKITRPFGDNGKQAENWSVNLLHPYPGNLSTIGDCYKLLDLDIPERKAIAVIGYEHNPPIIDLTPLVGSFEVIARYLGIKLSKRIETKRNNLVHPVHQTLRLFAWEVIDV